VSVGYDGAKKSPVWIDSGAPLMRNAQLATAAVAAAARRGLWYRVWWQLKTVYIRRAARAHPVQLLQAARDGALAVHRIDGVLELGPGVGLKVGRQLGLLCGKCFVNRVGVIGYC
jgi:hypothetical protein